MNNVLAAAAADIKEAAYRSAKDTPTPSCGNPSLVAEINAALTAVHTCIANTTRSPQTAALLRGLMAAMKYLRAIKAQNEPTPEPAPGDAFGNFPILRSLHR